MGSPAKSSSLQTFNMKSVAIVALCLLAAVSAEAEADPYCGYHGHHLGYGYGHLGHVYGHGYYGHGLHHGYYGKRSAEAEPEADAYYGYAHGLAYAHYPVVSTIHGYPHHAYPYAYGHGYHYGKREAEAEPTAAAEAAPEADAYYHHGYALGYGHPHGYYGHGYLHHGYYGYPHVYGGYYGYHH